MLVSYNWLQEYIEEELPTPEELGEALTMHAFEVEQIEKKGDDYLIDVDILPNRAHGCLSHWGIASEVATVLSLTMKDPFLVQREQFLTQVDDARVGVEVDVQEQGACQRYIGRFIGGITVKASPSFITERLELLEQKSINNIVDITNYIMLAIGQPLHAFDADKVEGGIVVRYARAGEQMTTLDEKEIELDDSMLIIADSKAPLALAGIKGGMKAAVSASTKNIILESAHFSPSGTRKTSRKVGIQNESSKRFEHAISPELASEGMVLASALIAKYAGGAVGTVGKATDVYPRPTPPYHVGVSMGDIQSILGVDISKKEVTDIFERLAFDVEFMVPVKKIKDIVDSGIVLGAPYVSGAGVLHDAPRTFDCSSLTAWMFVQSGIAIPRISVDQFVFADKITEDELQFGDFIFANTGLIIKTGIHKQSVEFLPGTKVPAGVDHLGMYVGDGKVLHTSSQTKEALIEDVHEAGMFKNIVGYGRIRGADQERFVLTIPFDRMDIRIKEDVVEEVARLYGYRNITAQKLELLSTQPLVNKRRYYFDMMRNVLAESGFSEMYTSSFVNKSKLAIARPVAKDKGCLRNNLQDAMYDRLTFNTHNADLLGVSRVKIFEGGAVFDEDGERVMLAMGVASSKKKKGTTSGEDIILSALQALPKDLYAGIKSAIVFTDTEEGVVGTLDLGALVETLPQPQAYDDMLSAPLKDMVYKTISPYPSMSRDVAVFTPGDIGDQEVQELLTAHAGELLVREPRLFDVFRKKQEDGTEKVSYAFRLVFQSYEKTLTDTEVHAIMERINTAIQEKGWEVR